MDPTNRPNCIARLLVHKSYKVLEPNLGPQYIRYLKIYNIQIDCNSSLLVDSDSCLLSCKVYFFDIHTKHVENILMKIYII